MIRRMDISAGQYVFKASGYTVKFDGFTVLYTEGRDDDKETDGPVPVLTEGTVLHKRELKGNQHFTQPPARCTEATLIKTLDEWHRPPVDLCSDYHYYSNTRIR